MKKLINRKENKIELSNQIVKIIIPILNPQNDFFTVLIPKLRNQTVKNEIILINSGQKIEENPLYKVININKKDFNHANTRNIALNYQADFYLFMTQDALPYDEKMIENLILSFKKDDDIVVSYARQIPYEFSDEIEIFARNKNYPKESLIKSKKDIDNLGIRTYFSSDSCAMYKVEYFTSVNGFEKDLNTNEDMHFAARAILYDNKNISYEVNAKVYHSHKYNLATIFKRYLEIGKFFKENSWIENSIKSTTQSGIKQAFEELVYILRNRPTLLFKSIIFSFVKFIAFKKGKN